MAVVYPRETELGDNLAPLDVPPLGILTLEDLIEEPCVSFLFRRVCPSASRNTALGPNPRTRGVVRGFLNPFSKAGVDAWNVAVSGSVQHLESPKPEAPSIETPDFQKLDVVSV